MLTLRPYQETDVEELMSLLDNYDRVAYGLPTGGGKTEVMIEVARRWNFRTPVTLVTHRRELVIQSGRRFEAAGLPVNISYNTRRYSPKAINIQTIALAKPPWGDYPPRGLTLVDEGHHSTAPTWEEIILQSYKVLSVSATWWRLTKSEGFDTLYDRLHLGPSIPELVEDGYLAKCLVKGWPEEMLTGLGVDKSGGDYNLKQMDKVLGSALVNIPVRKWYEEECQDRRTIFYALNVKTAFKQLHLLRDRGVSAQILLGDTPQTERDEVIANFRSGKTQVLVNVLVATEGLDVPEAECVVIGRPTESVALYLQMCGRAMRPSERDPIIVDCTDNWHRLGHPQEGRTWSLFARGIVECGEGGPTKICPECNLVVHFLTRHCPNCGHQFGYECDRCGAWVFVGKCKKCMEEKKLKDLVLQEVISPVDKVSKFLPPGSVIPPTLLDAKSKMYMYYEPKWIVKGCTKGYPTMKLRRPITVETSNGYKGSAKILPLHVSPQQFYGILLQDAIPIRDKIMEEYPEVFAQP